MAAKYTLAIWTRVMYSREYIYEVVYQGNSWWALRVAMFKNRKIRQRLEIIPVKKVK